MVNPLFEKLKEEFAHNPEAWVEGFGFHIGGRGDGILRTDHTCQEDPKGDFCTWWEDVGNFECKRCGQKSSDITDSYRILNGIEGDHAMTQSAEQLADEKGIEYSKFDPKKLNKDIFEDLPRSMTEEYLKLAQKRLMGEEGERCREFIREKWKVEPEDVLGLGIGSWHSKINKKEVLILPTYDEKTGTLSPRYKKQLPVIRTPTEKERGLGKKDRIWAGGDKSVQPPRLWPQVRPPEDTEEFVILEGESDLITARCRLDWPGAGVYPVSVYGKNTIPRTESFPSCMAGRKVTILLDIDAFQGPFSEIQGSDSQKKDTDQTTRGHVRQLAQFFRSRNCEVHLATVAGPLLDPVAHPKGDLTDWVDAGGRELGQLRRWTYDEIYGELEKVKELDSIADVLRSRPGQRIAITGLVDTLESESIAYPLETQISCRVFDGDMDKMCAKCGVPERFGVAKTQNIPWEGRGHELAKVLYSRDFDSAIAKVVCQKPAGCGALSVNYLLNDAGRRWVLKGAESTSIKDEKIQVVSRGEAPAVVGRVRVIGEVYNVDSSVRLLAESIEELDSNTVDLDPVRDDLIHLRTYALDTPEEIDRALVDMALDVGANITGISNREDLHIGTLLAMASSLRYLDDRDRQTRGWLDITIMGLPREGKSMTVERLFQELKMGYYSQANSQGSSIPGLTTSSHDRKNVKPGVWPINTGRAVCLDEMQCFLTNRHEREKLFQALQGARSSGEMDSTKCTSPHRFEAAVRTIFISNFPAEKAQFYCQDLQRLFLTGEAIARMDFPLIVDKKVSHDIVEHPHRYRLDLLRTLIQRAWAQEVSHVKILPEAFEEAAATKDRWEEEYESDEIALCAGDKNLSILRVAIAAANLLFSFSADDATLMTVEVRKSHVQWATQWMEECWRKAQYDKFSAQVRRANTVQKPVYIQALLTKELPDAPMVEPGLVILLESLDFRTALEVVPGDDFREKQLMFGILRRHNVLRQKQVPGKAMTVEPTEGGKTLIQNLINLSIQDEDLYERAQKQWANWTVTGPEQAPDISTEEDYQLYLQNERQW